MDRGSKMKNLDVRLEKENNDLLVDLLQQL